MSISLLHRCLRLQLHDKLVTFGVDELFAQVQEGEGRHCDNQGEVHASQGEDLSLAQGRCHWLLTH